MGAISKYISFLFYYYVYGITDKLRYNTHIMFKFMVNSTNIYKLYSKFMVKYKTILIVFLMKNHCVNNVGVGKKPV